MAVPLAVYFALLAHFWFDAPFWDDYAALLESTIQLQDATTPSAALRILFQQHNEHRIALDRLLAAAMATFAGRIDFRAVMLAGNLAWAGVLVLLWKEFRDEVSAPLFAAAAFLLLNLAYWQASLFAMAAASHMPAVLFAFASLAFAMRRSAGSVVWTILFALLATCSQSNGLFVLPIAAAGMLMQRRSRDAGIVALAAVLVALAYFHGYSRPPQHPSPMLALEQPLATLHLFLIIVGGIEKRVIVAVPAGVAILAALVWLARRGAFTRHPAAAAWVAFLLGSASAAAIGRVGLGVTYESRYAMYSSALLAIVALLFFANRAWSRTATAWTVVVAAGISVSATAMAWHDAREHSFRGHLLSRAVPSAPAVDAEDYFGIVSYLPDWAEKLLREVHRRGIYEPRTQVIHPTRLEIVPANPPAARHAGHVDSVTVSGTHVAIQGWIDVLPTSPGRTLLLVSPDAMPERAWMRATSRTDVAETLADPKLVFSGFRIEAEFASGDQAANAAGHLCVAARAPGVELTGVFRDGVACGLPR